MKKALITGVTGQDGSYLAELLLDKGYEVYGMVRRSSSVNTQRLEGVCPATHAAKNHRLKLVYGDLSDASSINHLVKTIRPQEIYNLAAQSHVKISFEVPEYTSDVTGLGALRLLEAIRESGIETRFYQASSSELYGRSEKTPQDEKTPFEPVSPYAVAKLFAYWTTVNYRESYGIFAANGILFNHETIASFMPMFCKKSGEEEFDIKPICEIVPFDESKRQYQAREVSNLCVWGKNGWTEVQYASAYPHRVQGDNKKPRFINSRSGAFMATSSHVGFMEGGEEKKTGDMLIGDSLEIIDLPEASCKKQDMTEHEAELLGMMVGDGSVTCAKRGTGVHGKFTNSSAEIRGRFSYLWSKVTGGSTKYYPSRSGFNSAKIVGQLLLIGGNAWLRSIDIYNQDRTKRVPRAILNSRAPVMLAFLQGYNTADGLKSNPCTYEFKNFKTNSPALAMGLWYLVDQTIGQDINLTVETKSDGRIFYSLNLLSPVDNLSKQQTVREMATAEVSQREISRATGISRTFIRKIQNGGTACLVHPLRKTSAEVKKIIEMSNYDGWFYDLETSSGEFHCGVGKIHVHNSPRRGENFVTRKITRAVARIKKGLENRLYLGNLEAKRDWGYAKDYVEAMWLMLQRPKPEDFVIATGQTHTVREFLKEAFGHVGLDYKKYVRIDKQYLRPIEVHHLRGNYAKARKKLGWRPTTSFRQLVHLMVDADLEFLESQTR